MAETTSPPAGPSDVDFVALKTGQTIGRYEILSILGQGGFGIQTAPAAAMNAPW